jgi:large subunit ribosomal protein L17
MRHKLSGRKLGRPASHRWALYRNLVTELFDHDRITTTLPKAKEIRSLADKMVTLGKEGSLASRRRALAFIYD